MQFENKITLGNVLTIIALVLGLSVGYSNLESRLSTQAEKVAAMDQTIRERILLSDSRAVATDTRVRAVEIMQASQTSDLRNIQVGINDIKSALERLGNKP